MQRGSKMITRLVIDGFGKYIGRKSKRIIIKNNASIVHQLLPDDLKQILILGKGAIGFDALRLLSLSGVDVILLNSKGEVVARVSPPEMRTVSTRREQYYAYRDWRGSALAKEFVLAKLKNQHALLGTFAKARKDNNPELANEIYRLRGEHELWINEVSKIESSNVDSIRESLMGIEGAASSIYWFAVANLIPKEFQFKGRSGRHALDPVNAMLNYGYGILEGEVWRAVYFAGLDPYGGFLHADRPGKPSLVLDLMEEFRQQLIDKTIMKLICKGNVKPSNFS